MDSAFMFHFQCVDINRTVRNRDIVTEIMFLLIFDPLVIVSQMLGLIRKGKRVDPVTGLHFGKVVLFIFLFHVIS